MRGAMDEVLHRMEWGCKLKAKMIDLGNIRLETKEYQITDLIIIPVLPIQREIMPVLTQDNTRLKINTK